MYNHLLDTFIAVMDCGSFNRAAGKLHITSTAVMKQMNTLEANLGLKLIERTPSGVYLTEAGARIYQDAKFPHRIFPPGSGKCPRRRARQRQYLPGRHLPFEPGQALYGAVVPGKPEIPGI